jgi:zinc protease
MRIRRLLSVAMVVATAALTAGTAVSARQQGMQAPPPQGVVIKGKAPVSTTTLKVTLPRPVEADLSNGLHLMVLEDRRAQQVSFQLLIPGAGGYYDPADLPGVASLTAAEMREGTPAHTTQQISEALETMAASLNVSTGPSSLFATMGGSCLTENLDALVTLGAEVLLTPTFPDEEFTKYKQQRRAGLVQQRSNPAFLASEMFNKALFGDHPAGRISITAEALDRTTRANLVAFHKTHYVPDHAVMAFAGDISMADAQKLVETKFSGWAKAGTPAVTSTDPAAVGPPKVYFVARPNSVQTSLVVGTQSIQRTDPDYDVLNVMNEVIGAGPPGRLFVILRETKGYTYGAYSNLGASLFRSAWSASMDVRTEVTDPALTDLLAEIARIRTEPVPEKELTDRKRAMVASFALSLESPAAVLNNYVTRWIYKLPADYWDKYPERVMAVTQAQVQAAAKKYLDPGRLQVVAVGDPTKIADLLKKFGPVETYDTNGKPIGK